MANRFLSRLPNPFRKKIRKRDYRKKRIDFDSIRWPVVVGTAATLVLVSIVVSFGIRALTARKPGGDVPSLPSPTVLPSQGIDSASLLVQTPPPSHEPTQADGSFENPIDLSGDVKSIQSSEKRVNIPDILGNEMVYSAGTGTINLPLLKTLYLYDFETDVEQKVVGAVVKDGEIFETVFNENYIVWVDTDQSGTNMIYYIERYADMPTPRLIKECGFAVPKLRLSLDTLIWTEQNSIGEERLYMFDLIAFEDLAIPGFTDSIASQSSTYGVSAPGIYGTQIIWAAPDPRQTVEQRVNEGEKSVIYTCYLDMLSQDDYVPQAYEAGMYVHAPITNAQAWAWIDRNRAPDSSLYLRYADETVQIAQEVTTYSLGDDMLVFAKSGRIYAYFYQEGIYGVISPEGEMAALPVVSGRRIVWFDMGASDKDTLKTCVIPYE